MGFDAKGIQWQKASVIVIHGQRIFKEPIQKGNCEKHFCVRLGHYFLQCRYIEDEKQFFHHFWIGVLSTWHQKFNFSPELSSCISFRCSSTKHYSLHYKNDRSVAFSSSIYLHWRKRRPNLTQKCFSKSPFWMGSLKISFTSKVHFSFKWQMHFLWISTLYIMANDAR